jgi:hypothetical protein
MNKAQLSNFFRQYLQGYDPPEELIENLVWVAGELKAQADSTNDRRLILPTEEEALCLENVLHNAEIYSTEAGLTTTGHGLAFD